MRLDVHPKSGDIVFDMAGDIYCLPAAAYNGSSSPSDPTKAVPILLGVPHDSDPHFSPEGERIVFRSDAELGVENIWVKEWVGCEDMDLRPTSPRGELQVALSLKNDEEALLAGGTQETAERRRRRLVREGRLKGMCILHFANVLPLIQLARLQPNVSRTRPIDGYQTHGFTLPGPSSLSLNGSPPPVASPPARAGSIQYPILAQRLVLEAANVS